LVLSILTYKILLLITNDSVLAQLIRWFETETKRYFIPSFLLLDPLFKSRILIIFYRSKLQTKYSTSPSILLLSHFGSTVLGHISTSTFLRYFNNLYNFELKDGLALILCIFEISFRYLNLPPLQIFAGSVFHISKRSP
jgi:hypothetical protein